jgi:AraC-like DNA-binding protein
MDRPTSDQVLAITGAYAPSVHYAAGRWHHDVNERNHPQHLKAYAVLAIEDGLHHIRLRGQQWRLRAGDLAILAPDQPWVHVLVPGARRLYAVGSLAHTSLLPAGGLTHRIATHEPAQPPPSAIWGVDLPVVQPRAVAQAAIADLRAICDLWWTAVPGLLRANHHFASIFLRAVLAVAGRIQPAADAEPADDVVRGALSAIDGRPPPASVAVWAAMIDLHRNRFADRFQAALGQSPGAYLRRLRLRRAEEMLLATDFGLDRIAVDAGYRDVDALRHAFTSAHRVPPSLWRRSRRAPA